MDASHLKNIIAYYNRQVNSTWTSKDSSYLDSIRALGVMEGILLNEGKLTPGEPFNYKDIIEIKKGWFGPTKEKKRKQSYAELILEKINDLINEYEH